MPIRLLTILLLLLLQCAALGVRGEEPTTPEPPAGTTIVHPVDGALMVYVPSGWFIMGMDADEADAHAKSLGYADYHAIAAEEWFPRRREFTKGYFIDKHEVTVARWKAFVEATGFVSPWEAPKWPAEEEPGMYDRFPVTRVLWAEAQKYANWCGKQLPTEKQWEKAARGTDGRIYPWGNSPLTTELGVFVDLTTRKRTSMQPVGSKPAGASPYGALDMAGNVYEWTSDWFEPYPNNPEAERLLSYTGHLNGVLRGGSFYHGTHTYSGAKRFGFKPDETYFHVGFRTVWEPPPGYVDSAAYADAKAAADAISAP